MKTKLIYRELITQEFWKITLMEIFSSTKADYCLKSKFISIILIPYTERLKTRANAESSLVLPYRKSRWAWEYCGTVESKLRGTQIYGIYFNSFSFIPRNWKQFLKTENEIFLLFFFSKLRTLKNAVKCFGKLISLINILYTSSVQTSLVTFLVPGVD